MLYNNNDFTEMKTAKRNSDGSSVLIRKELDEYIKCVKSYSDGIIWMKLSKEYTKTERDTYLCYAYIPLKTHLVIY